MVEWTPADLQADRVIKTWDVSKVITGPGKYYIEFLYTRGTHRLDFRKVALLSGATVIARHDQPGHSGGENVHNTYQFTITQHDPTVKFLLQAEIKADGGTDSYGNISIAFEHYAPQNINLSIGLPSYHFYQKLFHHHPLNVAHCSHQRDQAHQGPFAQA